MIINGFRGQHSAPAFTGIQTKNAANKKSYITNNIPAKNTDCSKQPAFSGAKKTIWNLFGIFEIQPPKELLLDAVKKCPPRIVVDKAKRGVFEGITLEDINSDEVKKALEKRKARQVFEGDGRSLELALEILRRPFQEKK